MSYSSMPHYYGSSSNMQNSQRGYATATDTSQSHPYHTQMPAASDNRQSQYVTNSYGWSDPAQNTAVQNGQNTQGSNSWHDRMSTSNSTYNYQPEVYAPSQNTNPHSHSYASRDTYNSQDTQGLNHLAYASGLEPPAAPNNNMQSSQAQSVGYNSSMSSAMTQMRAASPSNANVRYSTNTLQAPTQSSYRTTPNDTPSSANSHSLALDAAAALAGATRNRNQQTNPKRNAKQPVEASVSPLNAPSKTVTPTANHNPNLSYQNSVPAQSGKKTPANAHVSVARPVNHQSLANALNVQPPAAEARAISQKLNIQRNARELTTPMAVRQQPATSNPQSIANLVSDNSEGEVHETIENQEPMPNFIDPTRVFNPYHREHERKKREAAEAEARRKAEEQRLADERRKAEEQAAKRPIEMSTAANSKSKVTKKAPKATTGLEPQGTARSDNAAASPTPTEDAMAVEMQKMMAKMKEFRTTNPALFQKLWNDMRGGSANNNMPSGAGAIIQSPSPQVTQASLPANAAEAVPAGKPRSKKADSTSVSGGVRTNGYRPVVENNSANLPDLGRFPAERRIRHPYAKKADAVPEPELSSATPPATQVAPVQSPEASTKPPETNSLWPEPRRRAVAIAVVKLLGSQPENSSIPMDTEEICLLLERQPSYLDLCTALEARGLKFQRTTFARELLRSVPELQSPVVKNSTPVTQAVATNSSRKPVPPPANAMPAPQLSNATGELRDGRDAALKVEPSVKRQNNKPTKVRPSATSRPEPPPGSKEAAARKRDFAELIDLTELDNDDNYVLPSKQQRLDFEPSPNVSEPVGNGFGGGFGGVTSAPLKFNTQPAAPSQPPLLYQPPSSPYNMLGPQSALHGSQQRSTEGHSSAKSHMVLAKKVDKAAASQKSYYDPKTVARDILIASGRHPSERPLNVHLAGLISRMIDLDSDVSTFEWDAVDPGGPTLPKVAYVDIPAAPPRFKLGERRRRKRARQADIDKTREFGEDTRDARPTSRTPNQSHVVSLTTSPAPLQHRTLQDQNTINPQKKSGRSRHHGDVNEHQLNGRTSKSEAQLRKISIDIPISSPQSSNRSASNQATSETKKSAMDDNTTLSIKRRGRPPGAKNKNPSVVALKQQAKFVTTVPATAPAPAPATVVEELPPPVLHSYKCKWVKCHAELHNLDTLRRHIPKKHFPDEKEVKEGGIICWWKKCRFLAPDAEGNMLSTKVFDDRQEWASHIEHDHIQPIALKYGDGPKSSNTGKQTPEELDLSQFIYKPPIGPLARTVSYTDPQSVEKSRERWLADSYGRSTTPQFNSDPNSDHPPDAMVLTKAYPQGPKSDKEKSDITAQNAFLRAHGAKRDTRKEAEETVRAMEVRKEKIGPGLDRGGCTLINEARRNTFLQAPGISRVVDAEF